MSYPAALALVSVLVLLAERLWPARPQQRVLRSTLWSDALHLVFNGHFLGAILYTAGVRWVMPWVDAGLDAISLEGVAYRSVAADWPLAVQVLLALLVIDFIQFKVHRLLHRVPALWRFHQVHHADASFHVTTALRFHPGELLLALPVRLAAVVALGVPPAGVLLFEIVFGIANLLEHGNFDLPRRFEPLAQRVVITPALHRAHHVADWRELNTNFGTILSAWDRLAGTLRPSDGARHVVTGLPDWKAGRAPSLSESLFLPLSPSPKPFASALKLPPGGLQQRLDGRGCIPLVSRPANTSRSRARARSWSRSVRVSRNPKS